MCITDRKNEPMISRRTAKRTESKNGKETTAERIKTQLVTDSTGKDFWSYSSVLEALKVLCYIPEVHRFVLKHQGVLHRDESMGNIGYQPAIMTPEGFKKLNFIKPLDYVKSEETSVLRHLNSCCILADFDNSPDKDKGDGKDLMARTGTPAYVARAVSCSEWCEFRLFEPMPMLEPGSDAFKAYIAIHSEKKYEGFIIPPVNDPMNRGSTGTDHDAFHDAESVYWTLIHYLISVTPTNSKEEDTTPDSAALGDAAIRSHTMGSHVESRTSVMLTIRTDPLLLLHPGLTSLCDFLMCISDIVVPEYAYQPRTPQSSYLLHEAMQRLLLQQIFSMRNDPIPVPASKR